MKASCIAIIGLLTIGCNRKTVCDYFENGNIMRMYEVNRENKNDGFYYEFYLNGDTSVVCTYVNEKLDATFRAFFRDTLQYYSVVYRAGRLMNINSYKLAGGSSADNPLFSDGNGIISVYDPESGVLLSRHTYANGLPHGKKYIYLNGGRVDSVIVDSSKVPTFLRANFPPFKSVSSK
jgi:antitoxin component YwqK of YwqJK toxin-antitoxin module